MPATFGAFNGQIDDAASILAFYNDNSAQFGTLLSELSTAAVGAELFQNFSYLGFDPKVVAAKIIAKGKLAGKTDAQIAQDITYMVVILLVRGSRISAMPRKTAANHQRTIQGLIDTYSIQDQARAQTDITLPRVAACFPSIVVRAYQQNPGLVRFPVNPVHDLEICYLPGIASLIPSTDAWTHMYNNVVAAQREISTQLQAWGRRRNPNQQNQDNTEQIVTAARTSNYLTDNQKISILGLLGINEGHSINRAP